MLRNTHSSFAVFFVLLILRFTLYAGNENQVTSPELIENQPRISGEVFNFHMQADGSQYLYDYWVKGDVYLIDGSVIRGELFKYNAYLDELIWLHPLSFKPVQAEKDFVEGFTLFPLDGDTLFFNHVTIKPWYENEPLKLYAQELYEGQHISLVVQRRIKRTGETLKSSGARIIATPIIEPDPVFFVVFDDGEARDIKRMTRRAVAAVFPETQKEIRSLLRQEGIRINDQNDLVKAIMLIDTRLK